MKKFKKFVSLMLTVVLISSTFLMGIQVSAADNVPTIEVSKETVKVGTTTASVKVNLTNTEIAGYRLTVEYDESVLTYASVSSSVNVNVNNEAKETNEKDKQTGKIILVVGKSANITNDTLFTINFTLPSDAAAKFYPVTVSYDKDNDIANESGKYVNPYIINGGVTVVDTLPKDMADELDKIDDSSRASILNGIKSIETDDLLAALEDEGTADEVITALKELEKKLPAVNIKPNNSGIAEGDITVVGAALNGDPAKPDDALTLSLGLGTLPTGANVPNIPDDYGDNVVLDIKLTNNQGNPVAVKVPVTITMPVPTELIGKTIVILHYNETAKTYEPIYPKISADGKTMTFTVTSFSMFVFTSVVGGDIVLKDSNATGGYKISSNTAKPYITGVEPGTTIVAFLTKVKKENVASGDETKLYVADADDKKITTGIVGTGMKLKAEGSPDELAIMVIYADVDGDGDIGVFDILDIIDYVAGTKTFTEYDYVAADVDGDGDIGVFDILDIIDYVAGTRTAFDASTK